MSQVIRASAGFADQSGQAYQQHLCYCSNSRKWLLADVASGSTGSMNFYYNASEDFAGGSWVECASSPVTLTNTHQGGGANLSAFYKSINSIDVLHLIHGTLHGGNPNFDDIRLTFNQFSDSDINVTNNGWSGSTGTPTSAPYGLSVCLDSNNKRYDVGSNGTAAGGISNAAFGNLWGNADTGTSWSALGESGFTFGNANLGSEPNGIVLLPLSGGVVLALWEGLTDAEPNSMKNVRYALSTNFASEAGIGFSDLGAGVDPNNFGAVNRGGSDVHCVMRQSANTYQVFRFNGTSWSSGTAPPNQNSKAGAGLFMASDGTNVWLFVIDSDAANTVRFVKWNGATASWDAAWTAIETSSKTRNYISGCRDVSPGGVIGVIWTETNGATFDLVGAAVRTQPPPFTDFQVPKGRIPAVSLRTHLQATPLNLIGKDVMYGAAGQPRVETNQPNPPRGRPFPISCRGFVQGGSALIITPPSFPCGQIRQTEWPVPRGRPYPISLRTHLEPLKQLLLHQDQFFAAAGQPPANHDFPVPRGRTPPIVNRTHVQGVRLNLIGQDTFYAAAGQPPANQDFPNPRGRAAAIALRTFVQQTPLNLVGKDTFFGLAGQPPENHDFPVPRGRAYPVVLRTWTDNLKLNLLGQDAFGPGPLTRNWLPSDLTTLPVAWYKADALSQSDGTAVSSWTDSSGSGNALAQTTGFRQPTCQANIQNGLPVVRFDNTTFAKFMTKAFTLVQPSTQFTVTAFRAAYSSNAEVTDGGSNVTNTLFRSASTTMSLYAGSISCNLTTTPQSWHVYGSVFNGASSELRADGGTAATGNVGANNAGGSTLGAAPDASQSANVDIGEHIVLNYAPSTGDRQLIEGYLAWKWSLVSNLPSDHPYKTSAPTVATSTPTLVPFTLRPENRDWPVPRGRIPAISLRTHLQSLPLNLQGQDTFFAGAGVGPRYDWPNPRGRQRATSLLSLQVGYNPSLYPPIAFPSVVVMAQGWYAPQIVMGYQLPTAQGAYNQEIVSGFFPEDGT